MTGSNSEQPDSPPKALRVGVINPFALAEAILGRKLDWTDAATCRQLSNILQTDYEELFDMRFNSVLYAGVRLNERGDEVEPIPARDMGTLSEDDLVKPDLSCFQKLGDLGRLGVKDISEMRIKHAVMSHGNLHLTVKPEGLCKTLNNAEMTTKVRELCTPLRMHENQPWTPPNGSWVDIGRRYRPNNTMFSNPVQGSVANSYFVAALMSVSWSDPLTIRDCTCDLLVGAAGGQTTSLPPPPSSSSSSFSDFFAAIAPAASAMAIAREEAILNCRLTVKFYSMGGDKDAPTATVTVNCEVPTNNSSSLLMYCRPSSMNYMFPPNLQDWTGEIWPALYEKAFAKWVTGGESDTGNNNHTKKDRQPNRKDDKIEDNSNTDDNNAASQRPDLTRTAHGDPVKAMAQLTHKTPHYFLTPPPSSPPFPSPSAYHPLTRRHTSRTGADYLALVRAASSHLRILHPTVAWTYPTASSDEYKFRGCTLVGNMAYSVLGWAAPRGENDGGDRKQYLILRHPWGVTEPEGVGGMEESWPGVVTEVDEGFWPPVEELDAAGVFAVEAGVVGGYFAGMGFVR